MNKEFEQQLEGAIYKYGDDKVDIIVEEGQVYGVYYDSGNSFGVTETYKIGELGGNSKVESYEDKYNNLSVNFL